MRDSRGLVFYVVNTRFLYKKHQILFLSGFQLRLKKQMYSLQERFLYIIQINNVFNIMIKIYLSVFHHISYSNREGGNQENLSRMSTLFDMTQETGNDLNLEENLFLPT